MNKKRMNRRTFAALLVLGFLLGNLLVAVSYVRDLFEGTAQAVVQDIFAVVLIVLAVYLFVTFISAVLNRLHDLDWPWLLVILFGLFTPFLLVLALVPGQKGENKHGRSPQPKFSFRSAFIWW